MAEYRCPKCGATSEQAGNCPNCKVPMVESAEGGAAEPQQPTEPMAEPGQ